MSGLLTRRSALTGSAIAALGLAAGVAPALAATSTLSANDAHLVALADAYIALDATVNAMSTEAPGYDDLIDRFQPLEDAMAETPADTMVGILAKARACQLSVLRDCEETVSLSVADDLWRLFGGGVNA